MWPGGRRRAGELSANCWSHTAGPADAHIHGQVLLGVVVTAITAYLSVRFLVRYFQTRTLTPFGIYCLIAGFASLAYLQFIK